MVNKCGSEIRASFERRKDGIFEKNAEDLRILQRGGIPGVLSSDSRDRLRDDDDCTRQGTQRGRFRSSWSGLESGPERSDERSGLVWPATVRGTLN